MERLDSYGDNWRNVPITFEREEVLTLQQPSKREKTASAGGGKSAGVAGKVCLTDPGTLVSFSIIYVLIEVLYTFHTFQSHGNTEKGRRGAASSSNSASNSGSTSKRKSTKGERPEKDPNAPKRPANPFLQFCQEQRPLAVSAAGLERASGNTEGETSKQEITRQLASKWNTLPPEDKKVQINLINSIDATLYFQCIKDHDPVIYLSFFYVHRFTMTCMRNQRKSILKK